MLATLIQKINRSSAESRPSPASPTLAPLPAPHGVDMCIGSAGDASVSGAHTPEEYGYATAFDVNRLAERLAEEVCEDYDNDDEESESDCESGDGATHHDPLVALLPDSALAALENKDTQEHSFADEFDCDEMEYVDDDDEDGVQEGDSLDQRARDMVASLVATLDDDTGASEVGVINTPRTVATQVSLFGAVQDTDDDNDSIVSQAVDSVRVSVAVYGSAGAPLPTTTTTATPVRQRFAPTAYRPGTADAAAARRIAELERKLAWSEDLLAATARKCAAAEEALHGARADVATATGFCERLRRDLETAEARAAASEASAAAFRAEAQTAASAAAAAAAAAGGETERAQAAAAVDALRQAMREVKSALNTAGQRHAALEARVVREADEARAKMGGFAGTLGSFHRKLEAVERVQGEVLREMAYAAAPINTRVPGIGFGGSMMGAVECGEYGELGYGGNRLQQQQQQQQQPLGTGRKKKAGKKSGLVEPSIQGFQY